MKGHTRVILDEAPFATADDDHLDICVLEGLGRNLGQFGDVCLQLFN